MPTATTEGKVNEIRTACLVIVDTKTSFDTHNSVVKTNFMALFLLKMTTKQIKFSAVFYICPRKKRRCVKRMVIPVTPLLLYTRLTSLTMFVFKKQ